MYLKEAPDFIINSEIYNIIYSIESIKMEKVSKLLGNKKNLLGLLTILFLLLVGVALLVNIKKQQNLQRRAAGPTPDATLTLIPSSDNIAVGGTFTVTVRARTTNNPFYGVDAVLTFDRNVLEVTGVSLPSGTINGCTGNGIVLAPITSETDCRFKAQTDAGAFLAAANANGKVEFGAVAFDWGTATNDSNYVPSPLAVNTDHNVALVTFRGKPNVNGTSSIKLVTVSNAGSACPSTTLNCGTTDTNVAAISGTNEVGDVLWAVAPTNGLSITVGSGGPTATPTPPAGSCETANAGGPWMNRPMGANQTGTFTTEFDATPSVRPADMAVGLSNNSANAYTDLAAIVRFNTQGDIDVRNDGSYGADTTIGYSGGSTYHVRMTVDVQHHTYSVDVRLPGSSQYTPLASDYAFRSEQGSVGQLNNWAVYVNTGTGYGGTLQACNFTVGGVSMTPTPTPTTPAGGSCDSRVPLIDTEYSEQSPQVPVGKDGNIDFFEASLYINNYDKLVADADPRIPSTASSAVDDFDNNTTIGFGDVTLAINEYECLYQAP